MGAGGREPRAPKRLGATLAKAVSAQAPKTLLADVQLAWPEVCGATIAERSEPVSERDGTVTVACATGPWAQELEMISDVLVERIGLAVGEERVRKLRFTADLSRHRS